MKRRAALKALGLGAAATAMSQAPSVSSALFQHGVASGDPLDDRVIIWTRITPQGSAAASIRLSWEVTTEDGKVAARGDTATDAARDYTVKVDVSGLAPGTRYRYRFIHDGAASPTGNTRTLPVGDVDKLTIAACSCSNYPYGFFNVYKEMAANQDIDIVLHLGDYIYEYGVNTYSSKAIEDAGRRVKPAAEIVALEDYRERYALYRRDKDLQAVHAAHPFMLIWDDHEFTNDAWKGGAENHQPEKEGDWSTRRAAALQAYEEWMPTRADLDKPWRSFDIGNLARIMLLDTRLWGRDKQLNYAKDFSLITAAFDVSDDAAPTLLKTGADASQADTIKTLPIVFDMRQTPPTPILDYSELAQFDPKTAPTYLMYLPDVDAFKARLKAPDRQLLGPDQESWLEDAFITSKERGQTWQILGQQVLMGRINIPENAADFVGNQTGYIADRIRWLAKLAAFGLPLNMDAWDGYPAARERVLGHARKHGQNVVVLAGDTHNAWVSELADTQGPVAHEFATASVSSPGFEGYVPADPAIIEKGFLDASPTLKWVDAQHRGYLTMRFTHKDVETQFHRISTVKSTEYERLEPVRFQLTAADDAGEQSLTKLV
ncbi:MAG: alkaline phosphatase D family protein [Pseudomonadota bacterium]